MTKQDNNIERTRVVIFLGGLDFGRCILASKTSRALWPIGDKPALQYMIEQLAEQGIRNITVSWDGDTDLLLSSLNLPKSLEVEVLNESLPRGTAGCLKTIVLNNQDEAVVVFNSIFVFVPDIAELVNEHKKGGEQLTMFFHPDRDGKNFLSAAPLYICQPAITEFVPEVGYFDLKEGLVPALVRAGRKINAVPLKQAFRSFRNWVEYLDIVTSNLNVIRKPQPKISETAQIAPSAKVVGDVVIGHNSVVSDHAIIIGPSDIGSNCKVHPGAFISDTVVWNGAQIGPECQLKHCVVDAGKAVLAGKKVYQQLLANVPHPFGRIQNILTRAINNAVSINWEPKYTLAECLSSPRRRAYLLLGCVVLLCAMVGLYWKPTLVGLAGVWTISDEFSSGMLVPALAVFVLWMRRKYLSECPVRPAIWIGGGLLLLAQGVRMFGLYYMFRSLENLSLMMTIVALIVMLFGLCLTVRLWSVLAFLCLMLPFPNRVRGWIGLPLQEWATASAVFVLETLGFNVIRQGNVINLNGTLVAVAEACNGLRMLTAFIVVAGLVVLIMRRTLWEKLIVLLSCIPIAMLCNTLRLAVTSIAFTLINSDKWEKAFHDYGGLAMMPFALLLIILELWFLKHLFYRFEPLKLTAEEVIHRKTERLL